MNDYLKVDSINKSLNFYLNKRVSTIKEKINNDKLIHVPFSLKIKVIFINILRVNFINENYFLKKVYEFIKLNKNSKFNNKVVDNNLEYFLLIFKFYNFKNKLRFVFHL